VVRTYSVPVARDRPSGEDAAFKPAHRHRGVVRSLVARQRGPDPAGLSAREDRFRLEDLRRDDPGVSMVETFRNSFASEVNQNGVDGLIKPGDRNKQLAAGTSLKIDADRIDNSNAASLLQR